MKNSALVGALVKIMGIDWPVVEKVFQKGSISLLQSILK